MATGDELVLFLIEDLSGCWVRLDPSQPPPDLRALAVHPSGRFVFASGRPAPGRAGVAAYAIVPERGALDGLGASLMGQQWWDVPGTLVASERAVYMLGRGPYTGYHGGLWRWSFDTADGGLAWRGSAGAARDPFFLAASADRRIVYLGTEILEPRFRNAAVALEVDAAGTLRPVGETTLPAPARPVIDPSGRFVWLVSGYSTTSWRIAAHRPGPDGTLGPAAELEWGRRAPVAHPSGGVLYTMTSTHVEAHAVDPETGTPRLTAQVPHTGGDLQPLAVHPSGRYLYAVSSEGVRAFHTDAQGHLEEFGRVGPGGTHVVLTRVP
jgi:6-phosphogluconolactonase (cycloisomerase 2 family)